MSLDAVFFASYCGISRHRKDASLIPAGHDEESDLRSLSVREAVNFAKSTNLLGVILEATTLVSPTPPSVTDADPGCRLMLFIQAAVPSLVASVKDAGLLLATFGQSEDVSKLRTGTADGRTVDAFVIDG